MIHYDILVIGGGPAAITIAKTINGTQRVGIIRPEEHSMIYCAMPYAIEKVLPVEKTFKKDSLVTDTGAVLIRDSVTKIDFDKRQVHTKHGGTYGWGKLVLATGAVPILPPIPGTDLNRVQTFKTEHDLRSLLALCESGTISKAVVVGAGAIGVELAQAFHAVGVETHLVDLAGSILSAMMDRDMVEEAEAALTQEGIRLHLASKVVELRGTDSVEQVLLSDGRTIELGETGECALEEGAKGKRGVVVFAVGMRVDTSLFEGSGLVKGKDGIVVNDRMETNLQNVYALGDCAQFVSGITGQVTPGKLATNAVPMAKVFARNQLGESRSYPGFFNGAATRIGSYFVGGTGLTEKGVPGSMEAVTGHSELTTIFPNMPGAKKVRMKMIAEKGTLRVLGAQFLSGEPVTDKVDVMTLAIQNRLTVTNLAELSYSAQPYQSFFPASNLMVAAAEEILNKVK
jgi:NADH dehydrogenase/NADH oxidase (H2O2-forming)